MKRILGLDLGTTSIGWAYVWEKESDEEMSKIKQIGVRVNPLTVDEQTNFEKGRPFSVNADRTLKRGMRRNLDRYQDRRKLLRKILLKAGIIDNETKLAEDGRNSTFSTWETRAKSVTEKVELEDFARILFAINKKRGYRSNRKAKNEDEGQAIDGMAIAKRLYEEELTPGQLVFQLLKEGKKAIPDFYRSDLQNEFDLIWKFQKQYHPEILTADFYEELKGKGQRATSAAFWNTYGFNTAEIKDLSDELVSEKTIKLTLRDKKRLQAYKWRSDALEKQLDKEVVAFVFTEINNNLNNSSGYLGAISDRSKELFFNKQTIGQYLYQQLLENSHNRLKNQVFYRQDYLDEFETIWTTQAQYYPVLNNDLKSEVRDTIIFYQRKLKSQKGLISFCELESKEVKLLIDGKPVVKTIGSRVAPRSSPLFQEFKIWQVLNNVEIKKKGTRRRKSKKDASQVLLFNSDNEYELSLEDKQFLFEELNIKGTLKANDALKLLNRNPKDWEINYTEIEGNNTNKALYEAYLKIMELSGHSVKEYLHVKSSKDEIELGDIKKPASEIKKMVEEVFHMLEIDTEVLKFDTEIEDKNFEKQKSYQLWHLLYSYEGDDSNSGNERLYELLKSKYGFEREYAVIIANVTLLDDYGSLSSKAIRNIFPYIKENKYSEACELAGYRHSKKSLTKEELEARQLKPRLELLKKNSLRQPVVEKILNQMINVVNALIDKENDRLESEGKARNFHFDEIRIELARELKKNAEERRELTAGVNEGKLRNEKIANIIQKEFGIKNPTRNDIVRYRLYEELSSNAYKDLYTNTKIEYHKLFEKDYDVDHIIPQSRLFDDSFSNKVLVPRQANLEKSNKTAFDYMSTKSESELSRYVSIIETLFKEKRISKAKYLKLLKQEEDIGDGFIERDLRETQYIAKKAKDLLFEITPSVVATSGNITNRLRDDWDLINVMKELNLPKYRTLGLTEMEERKYGQKVEVIKDWTKRNDHRHHAMDALTIAFTKRSFIQYLNNLNARRQNEREDSLSNTGGNTSIETSSLKIATRDVLGIEDKETEVRTDDRGNRKRVFKEPIPNFRQHAKKHIKSVLISHKAKNKVVTRNKNKIAGENKPQITLTPRGQLHKETVYGQYQYYVNKEEKVGAKFDEETISKVSNPTYREALFKRLKEFDGDAKKAFTARNSLSKNPIYLDGLKTLSVPERVNLTWLETAFSIRKDINSDNFKNEKSLEKVLDEKIKAILSKRLKEFGGDAKKAFTDLDKNPIWQNQEKGIAIKRVAIRGVSNAEALHYKKDHLGNYILDVNGNKQAVDFVSTGNNHHVAIYKDEKGNLQEQVVSFYEAVARVNQGLPIINKTLNQEIGWEFLFTMKQNEMFVFPNEDAGFNPLEIDLLNPENKEIISPHLFRVQKIATRNYMFRQHLETTVDIKSELKGELFKHLQSSNLLRGIIKVRINNLGDIVSIGEY